MSEAYLGEIRIFAGIRVPQNWMACNGQVLQISGNEALYSLIGTQYGGDGRTTFALPDLRGRLVAGVGQGTGLSAYTQGQTFGTAAVTLTNDQTAHSHPLMASTSEGTSLNPQNNVYAAVPAAYDAFTPGDKSATTQRPFDAKLLTNAGGSQGHSNLMPSLTVTYIICTVGIFPQLN